MSPNVTYLIRTEEKKKLPPKQKCSMYWRGCFMRSWWLERFLFCFVFSGLTFNVHISIWYVEQTYNIQMTHDNQVILTKTKSNGQKEEQNTQFSASNEKSVISSDRLKQNENNWAHFVAFSMAIDCIDIIVGGFVFFSYSFSSSMRVEEF